MADNDVFQSLIRDQVKQLAAESFQINVDINTMLQKSGFTDEEITQWLDHFYTFVTAKIMVELGENVTEGELSRLASEMEKGDYDFEKVHNMLSGNIESTKYQSIIEIVQVTMEKSLKEFIAITYTSNA